MIATLSAVEIASAAEITSAQYSLPTERYQHGILGDTVEYGGLEIQLSDGQHLALTLPKTHVFEDLTPRLWDVDLDGNPEIVVIETSLTKGARLSIYDENGFVTATPYIGRSHRWLAPIGALDMDRDGYVEIAYIDRPHLAKTLKVWRFKNGKLVHVADQTGLTNHRIGWAHIPGGIRDCDGQYATFSAV
ncbi:MAG: VCBS repeat-containing protein [Paracoccaceae bacterium]|nr:VCBS repeat-containing protein [Paracoccaceae bacterium]